ncbi:apolipoprotein N-acyltransferase [Thalassococcus sp. S3]|uniref:apolipoprotein N-acyltransferase n=1 Tax=Thalassococcus sp. S3 TaxID=2017482 RepID=UPI00102465A3|nr:apolipoprotein N-acyltransferase [Thalassococcus sp. S3]QBF30734.1 apolipoprotein N-acyltransferase [Thalassococcus sp. S3]
MTQAPGLASEPLGVLDRILNRVSPRRISLVAALAGVIGAFGLAPYGAWPLALLSFILLFVLHRAAPSARTAGWTAWAFATGYFSHALSWIVEPFLVDAPRYGWMAPFALVLLAGGLALFWAVAGYLAWRLNNRPSFRAWTLVFFLSVAEFGRAYVFSGFPWAAPSQIWIGQGFDLSLAWIGPHGLTLLTLILCVLPAFATSRARLLALLLPVSLLPALAALALAQLPAAPTTGQTVRLVQPNAPQHQKWDPAHMQTFFDRQISYTSVMPHPDLIVWPETSVPTFLGSADYALQVIAEAAGETPVVVGIQRREDARFYNSMVVLGAGGRIVQTYDKHHLVPFGEYMPLGNLAARFGIYGLAANDGHGFSAGPGPRTLDFGGVGRGLALICYEAVFPQDMHAPGDRPDFLMQITNDAWFGAFSGPYQHLAQARMRSIEQGLPMIRVANTGVSAMIDPFGRVLDSLPLNEAGYLDATLPQAGQPTLYARTGDWAAFGILLIFGVALVGLRRTV